MMRNGGIKVQHLKDVQHETDYGCGEKTGTHATNRNG